MMQDPESGNTRDRPESLYHAAVRRFKREGEELDDFLSRNTQAIVNARFPGPACLHPDELYEYRLTGKLQPDRADHLLICDACTAMVDASQPDDDRLAVFREAVTDLHASSFVSPDATSSPQVPVLALTPPRLLITRNWAWALATAATVVLTAGALLTVRHPVGSDAKAAHAEPIDSKIIVTAQLSPRPSSPIFVRTPPITVTASASDAASTIAATAAMLTHLHSVEIATREHSSSAPVVTAGCSSPKADCQQLVTSYAAVLSDYLQDKKSKPTIDVATWFAQYTKTHPEEVKMLEVASNSGNGSVPADPRPINQTAQDALALPVVSMLETASSYYSQTAKRLSKTQATNENVSLDWKLPPDAMLNVQVGKSTIDGRTRTASKASQ